jgi:hypothetical protein
LSVVGTAGTRTYELMPAVPINEYVGLEGKGPIRVEAACATGSAAVYTASTSIVSGQAYVQRNIVNIKNLVLITNNVLLLLLVFKMLKTKRTQGYVAHPARRDCRLATKPNVYARSN